MRLQTSNCVPQEAHATLIRNPKVVLLVSPCSKSAQAGCHCIPCSCSRSAPELTVRARGRKIRRMPKPEAAHRTKSYSAATGYVYQYYFFEVAKTTRGGFAGTEYIYMVSTDRKTVFPLRVFVRRDVLDTWAARNGRQLTGTEEYAVAKMRLFQAFDEVENMLADGRRLVIDAQDLSELLGRLGIE